MEELSTGLMLLFVIIAIPLLIVLKFMPNFSSKHIFDRKGNQEGEQLAHRVIRFSSSASMDEIAESVLSTLNWPSEIPEFIGKRYAYREKDVLIMGIGSKRGTGLMSSLRLKQNPDSLIGMWDISSYVKVNGVMREDVRKHIKEISEAIRTGVKSTDPSATITMN